MTDKIDRDLCPKCETIKWFVDIKSKGKSVGIEWATCKKCGNRFNRQTNDEDLTKIK